MNLNNLFMILTLVRAFCAWISIVLVNTKHLFNIVCYGGAAMFFVGCAGLIATHI